VLVHGSFNLTLSGLTSNVESLEEDFNVMGCARFLEQFDALRENSKALQIFIALATNLSLRLPQALIGLAMEFVELRRISRIIREEKYLNRELTRILTSHRDITTGCESRCSTSPRAHRPAVFQAKIERGLSRPQGQTQPHLFRLSSCHAKMHECAKLCQKSWGASFLNLFE